MKIVLDSSRVAVFFESSGAINLQADGCYVGVAFNPAFTTSNAEVVDVPPPEFCVPNCFRLEGETWVVVDEATVAYLRASQKQAFNAEQAAKRKAAYTDEADPLYFMAQRGEATMAEWEAKVAEIKARYPYYFDDNGNLLEAAQ